MGKKEYIKPEVEVLQIELQSMILSGSGEDSGNIHNKTTDDQW